MVAYDVPEQVFWRLVEGIASRRPEDLHSLYAEDAVVTQPFAVTRSRQVGRAALREYFSTLPTLPFAMTVEEVVVHRTPDPELIIVEFAYHGVDTRTERAFTVPHILVLRVRDGEIVESRDYAHHLAFMFDKTDEWWAALADREPEDSRRVQEAAAFARDGPTPRDVFGRLINGISAGRWAELSALYAEDTVVDQPFVIPPARPQNKGRAAIHAHFSAVAKTTLSLHAQNVLVYDTSDPEVLIAEYDYLAQDSSTGRSALLANIQVLRVRDGLIRVGRDYHDHMGLAYVMDRPPRAADHEGVRVV